MILQLNPMILVDTPLGKGQALFIIDYGMHQNTCWVVTLNHNGVIKHFDCNDVIICKNWTYRINESNHSFESTKKPKVNDL